MSVKVKGVISGIFLLCLLVITSCGGSSGRDGNVGVEGALNRDNDDVGNGLIADALLVGQPFEINATLGYRARSLVLDSANRRLLFLSGNRDLVSMNLVTGELRKVILSDNDNGFWFADRVVWDQQNQRLFLIEEAFTAVGNIRLQEVTNPRNGDLRNISMNNTPGFFFASDAFFDARNSNIVVANSLQPQIITIDTDSGIFENIESIVFEDSGINSIEGGVSSMVPDLTNDQIFIIEASQTFITGIDLTDGNRTVISSSQIGEGPEFESPIAMVIDTENRRLYVTDNDALFEVDITSGDRRVISDSVQGSGPNFDRPKFIAIDSQQDLAYIIDRDETRQNTLYEVDLGSGDRRIIFTSNDL